MLSPKLLHLKEQEPSAAHLHTSFTAHCRCSAAPWRKLGEAHSLIKAHPARRQFRNKRTQTHRARSSLSSFRRIWIIIAMLQPRRAKCLSQWHASPLPALCAGTFLPLRNTLPVPRESLQQYRMLTDR